MIIDSHVHIYPDAIACKAAASIGDFYDIPMKLDGTIRTLLSKDREAGIDRQLVHSVAVTPKTVESINRFIVRSCEENPQFIGFATMHPDHPDVEGALSSAKEAGLRGVKLHPDFQHFHLDDENAIAMFRVMADLDLPVLIHTGDYRYSYSEPKRMYSALEQVPHLRVICAHLGGWSIWKEAWQTLAGHPRVWVDSSSSLYALSGTEAVSIIRKYGAGRVFFGTDYPMWDPSEELNRFDMLPLTQGEKRAILCENIMTFLHLDH